MRTRVHVCIGRQLRQFPWEMHQASVFTDDSSSGGATTPDPFTCTRCTDTVGFRLPDLDENLEVRWLLKSGGSSWFARAGTDGAGLELMEGDAVVFRHSRATSTLHAHLDSFSVARSTAPVTASGTVATAARSTNAAGDDGAVWLSASYQCAYLSQRQTQFLACPPEVALTLPAHIVRPMVHPQLPRS